MVAIRPFLWVVALVGTAAATDIGKYPTDVGVYHELKV
jgi:hypothetical protein